MYIFLTLLQSQAVHESNHLYQLPWIFSSYNYVLFEAIAEIYPEDILSTIATTMIHLVWLKSLFLLYIMCQIHAHESDISVNGWLSIFL